MAENGDVDPRHVARDEHFKLQAGKLTSLMDEVILERGSEALVRLASPAGFHVDDHQCVKISNIIARRQWMQEDDIEDFSPPDNDFVDDQHDESYQDIQDLESQYPQHSKPYGQSQDLDYNEFEQF